MAEPAPEPTNPPEGAQGPPGEPTEEPDTFPREYVEELREESRKHRERAKQATTFETALRDAVLKSACAGILHDPIPWDDSYNDAEGMPSAETIRKAAEALAESKPHLARVRGDAGQGFRGEQSDTVDLAGMLRAGA